MTGIAKIVSETGSGAYTITQYRWDGTAYVACSIYGGLVAATARDAKARTGLAVDEYVVFWVQERLGGVTEIVFHPIDIPGADHPAILVYDSTNGVHWLEFDGVGAADAYKAGYVKSDGSEIVDDYLRAH